MSVDTTTDWLAIKAEIEGFFDIPDGLAKNGISAIRAMIFRRRGGETVMLLDICYGEVGMLGEELDDFAHDSFRDVDREEIFKLGNDIHPEKGLVTKEIRGDVVAIEYLDVPGAEELAAKMVGGMLTMLGNYANRNQ